MCLVYIQELLVYTYLYKLYIWFVPLYVFMCVCLHSHITSNYKQTQVQDLGLYQPSKFSIAKHLYIIITLDKLFQHL